MTPTATEIVERSLSFVQPFIRALEKVAVFIPNLIGAIILLLLGKFIAGQLQKLVEKVLTAIRFDKFSKKVGLTDAVSGLGLKLEVDHLLAIIVYWIIYLLFIFVAIGALGIDTLSMIVEDLIDYIPNVIAAMVVLLVGIVVANWIKEALYQIKHGKLLGKVAYFVIVVFVAVSAIEQLAIDVSFITDNLKIVIAGLSLGIGLAFGLGGQDDAKYAIKKFLGKK